MPVWWIINIFAVYLNLLMLEGDEHTGQILNRFFSTSLIKLKIWGFDICYCFSTGLLVSRQKTIFMFCSKIISMIPARKKPNTASVLHTELCGPIDEYLMSLTLKTKLLCRMLTRFNVSSLRLFWQSATVWNEMHIYSTCWSPFLKSGLHSFFH